MIILASCSSKLENRVNELIENKNKWVKSAQNSNYSYTRIIKCACKLHDKRMIIKVLNGKVVSAKFENGKKYTIESTKTIKQHFEFVFENLKREEQEGDVTLDVEYNKKLGYPSLISINIKNKTHGRAIFLISNVVLQ